jgi:outer membrane protein assembly factor BamB
MACLWAAFATIHAMPGLAVDRNLPVHRGFESRLPPGTEAAAIPDDSEATHQAAIARLRSAPPREVCRDKSGAIGVYGSACATREFAAPPLLEAPKFQWTVNPGWWGVWSPFLSGNLILTGSCNNEDNKGLSALDMRTGKTVWRISNICEEGNRGGSMGQVAFFPLRDGTVLFYFGRDDGPQGDHYLLDVKAGKILRTLKPVKRGGLIPRDGLIMVQTYSIKEKTSYLNGLSEDMGQLRWRLDLFRSPCEDPLAGCPKVFSPGAYSDGIQYFSITAKDQPEPPTRQLHAIEVQSGKLLWKHADQPVYRGVERSDDGTPMVADGKVIIRVGGLLGAMSRAGGYSSHALRALDAKTGKILWTTESFPTYFKQEWLPARPEWGTHRAVHEQTLGNIIAVGDMLIVEVHDRLKEFWGYRLADGKLMWRRPVAVSTRLTAASGGVFYTVLPGTPEDEIDLFQGLDAQTGTLLWSTKLPSHNLNLVGEWGLNDLHSNLLQGPSWRIGRDGAVYGVTLRGVFKLQ